MRWAPAIAASPVFSAFQGGSRSTTPTMACQAGKGGRGGEIEKVGHQETQLFEGQKRVQFGGTW